MQNAHDKKNAKFSVFFCDFSEFCSHLHARGRNTQKFHKFANFRNFEFFLSKKTVKKWRFFHFFEKHPYAFNPLNFKKKFAFFFEQKTAKKTRVFMRVKDGKNVKKNTIFRQNWTKTCKNGHFLANVVFVTHNRLSAIFAMFFLCRNGTYTALTDYTLTLFCTFFSSRRETGKKKSVSPYRLNSTFDVPPTINRIFISFFALTLEGEKKKVKKCSRSVAHRNEKRIDFFIVFFAKIGFFHFFDIAVWYGKNVT